MQISERLKQVKCPECSCRFGWVICILLCLLIGIQEIQAQQQPDSTVIAYKDSLFFYNGQMLLGELLTIDQGRVSFDSDVAGVVSIKNHKIRTLSANIHFYRIRTSQMHLIYGKLHRSSKDGMVIIDQGISVAEVPIRSIIELAPYDQTFWQRISGKVALGYNFTKSSDIGRLNTSLSLRYLAQNYESNLNANFIMTQDKGSFTRDTENVSNSHQFSLSYRWILVGLISYQRNLELGILRRFQEAGLVGYNLINFNNRQLSAAFGAAVNQEVAVESEKSSTLVEVPVIITYTFYQFQKPNIQFSLSEKAYFGVTQSGRIRNDATLDISWEVISDFTIGANLYSNFDNQASETTTSNFDYGIVLNVGYKF